MTDETLTTSPAVAKRLVDQRLHYEISIDRMEMQMARSESEAREMARYRVMNGMEHIKHAVSTEAPDCDGCMHMAIEREQLEDHRSNSTRIRITAKCNLYRECRRSVPYMSDLGPRHATHNFDAMPSRPYIAEPWVPPPPPPNPDLPQSTDMDSVF